MVAPSTPHALDTSKSLATQPDHELPASYSASQRSLLSARSFLTPVRGEPGQSPSAVRVEPHPHLPVARATGASRSALIRQAVRRTFGPLSKADKLRALEASAGNWSGRNFTGAEYVDAILGDMNERLRALGTE